MPKPFVRLAAADVARRRGLARRGRHARPRRRRRRRATRAAAPSTAASTSPHQGLGAARRQPRPDRPRAARPRRSRPRAQGRGRRTSASTSPTRTSPTSRTPLAKGLRANARQLVEAPALGYEIGNDASPMTIVDRAWPWRGRRRHDDRHDGAATGRRVAASIGELALGEGMVRIVGGALPTPTEDNDHRYGLRDYAMTYTGLFIMENAIRTTPPAWARRPGRVQPGAPAGAAEAEAGQAARRDRRRLGDGRAGLVLLLALAARHRRRRRAAA